jgi:hypothetical protein
MGMLLAQRITPDHKTILYVDSAEGWVSLENHPQLKKRTLFMPYTNFRAFEAIANAHIADKAPWGNVGCIVLDEASSMATSDLDAVVRQKASENAGKDPDTPTQPDYNTSTNRVRKYLGELIKLQDVHVILISHVRKDKDNMSRETIGPNFLPKLSIHLRGTQHLVAYMSGDEMTNEEGGTRYVRTFQVHPTTRIIAKTRIGGLEPVVTANDLIKKVKEWLDGKEETVVEPEPAPIIESVTPILEESELS